jgi:hypothetical protein
MKKKKESERSNGARKVQSIVYKVLDNIQFAYISKQYSIKTDVKKMIEGMSGEIRELIETSIPENSMIDSL